MMKKIILFLTLCLTCLCLVGCEPKHTHDTIDIFNKSDWIFDNIRIAIKDGYFYDSYEKFTVDENTVGVTIYFTNNSESGW